MAKVTFSALVSDVKGSIGPLVFRKNGGGVSVQMKASPPGGISDYQRRSREILAKVSAAWPGRSDRDMRSWENYCLQHPRRTSSGALKPPDPYSVFCAREVASQWCFPYPIFTHITREPFDFSTLIRVVQEPETAHLSVRLYLPILGAYYAVWFRFFTSARGCPVRRQWTQIAGNGMEYHALLTHGTDEYGEYREPQNAMMDSLFSSSITTAGYCDFKVIFEVATASFARRYIGPTAVVPVPI